MEVGRPLKEASYMMHEPSPNVASNESRVVRRDSGRFGMVAHDVMHDPALSMQAKCVYATLTTYADRCSRGLYLKQKSLAEALDVSVRTVYSKLKELEAAGYLEIVPQTARSAGIAERSNRRVNNDYVLLDGHLMYGAPQATPRAEFP